MKFMGATASEDVADEDNGDVEEDIVDRFLVRSNSDPGKKAVLGYMNATAISPIFGLSYSLPLLSPFL